MRQYKKTSNVIKGTKSASAPGYTVARSPEGPATNEVRIEAHDLFGHFTEGVIKQHKTFVR